MPALAVAIYVLYLVIAFVVRGAIQWRRTGDTGFRLRSDRPGSAQWWARVGFVLALLLGGVAPVLVLVGWIDLVAALDRPAILAAGAVLGVASVVAVFVAQLAMGSSWRVGVDPAERTDLIVRWPFTLVRNPIFTTMAMGSIGLALLAPTWLGLGAAAVLVLSLEYQVRNVEEPYLRATHGARYREYAAHVGRFVPGIGKLDVG
jgi:protein-S-isoprenylcysteine O-methyltransferase Ste14